MPPYPISNTSGQRSQPERPPSVRVPIANLHHCSVCKKKAKVQLCSNCVEVAYCGQECQKGDWKDHKTACRRHLVDRLDLTSFYPFLAWLMGRAHGDKDVVWKHPALTREIVNSVEEQVKPAGLGLFERTIHLGQAFPSVNDSMATVGTGPRLDAIMRKWWPKAPRTRDAYRLLDRINNENGGALAMVVCLFGVLVGMYTDTGVSIPGGGRVPRLVLNKHPIVDFGIAKGRYIFPYAECIKYKFVPENMEVKLSDPENHTWMYFTTATGETAILDCNALQFNIPIMVDCSPYLGISGFDPNKTGGSELWPAWFTDCSTYHSPRAIGYYERERFSMLRDSKLQEAALMSDTNALMANGSKAEQVQQILVDFAERVVGRPCEFWEQLFLKRNVIRTLLQFEMRYRHGEYLKYPAEPLVSRQSDWEIGKAMERAEQAFGDVEGETEEEKKARSKAWKKQFKEMEKVTIALSGGRGDGSRPWERQ
ncbi:hypothetical protein BKA70DRAFT_1264839 [Coprinopsis sp. MPI-PUGE-AT-0042]|nr:hypothetical protein BKA70DRAFT_1264839 [Coprinopsis sp. MPI-PUGE-AT-0042]